MSKNENQKLKMMYLAKLFYEETDENHGVTMPQILAYLEKHDIKAERKSIYSDIELLRDFGMDIANGGAGKNSNYALVSRDFELAELKLLVDSVQSAKFVTEKKSRTLIGKIEKMTSRYEAGELQHQVIVSGRVKSANESVYYNVDMISQAIDADREIIFNYCNWDINKKLVQKRGGDPYIVSPCALVWDDEYYYLIGIEDGSNFIKHFRVDKMIKMSVSDDRRKGMAAFEEVDLASYSKRLFGMFEGAIMKVRLKAADEMVGVLLDRFGTDIPIIKGNDGFFETVVEVAVSRQFLGWIIGLGPKVSIIGPDEALAEMQNQIKSLNEQYHIGEK